MKTWSHALCHAPSQLHISSSARKFGVNLYSDGAQRLGAVPPAPADKPTATFSAWKLETTTLHREGQ